MVLSGILGVEKHKNEKRREVRCQDCKHDGKGVFGNGKLL